MRRIQFRDIRTPNIHSAHTANYISHLQRCQPDLAASFLLAFSATIFALRCPERVGDFSESQWVDELKHPRVQYIGEDIRRWWSQLAAISTLLVGGGLSLWLLIDRVWAAVAYLGGS